MKIKGVVTRRDSDTFTVRDNNGVDTIVRLDNNTSVKTKGGFLRSGANYASNANPARPEPGSGRSWQRVGRISRPTKIRFNDSDLRVARAVESRAAPLEDRASNTENKLSQVEQNAQRLSGQLDEFAAVANTAKGGARAAQETADSAVAGVNATNDRISALDDYVPQTVLAVTSESAVRCCLADSKTKLDEIATKALNAKGYVLRGLRLCGCDRQR